MRQSSERLPWLEDEAAPARTPAAAPGTAALAASPARPARSMWPWYLLLVALVALVGVGAYWLGTAQRPGPSPALSSEDVIPITPEATLPTAIDPAADTAAVPDAGPAPSPTISATAPSTRAATPVRARPAPLPGEADEGGAATADEGFAPVGRSAFPADKALTAPPPPTGPAPVVVNRNPNRGRVVQLGAFPTRAQAEDSWRRVTRRYPYLATKPKMVNTVDVRGLGGGRPTRMYRLQLGTSSQAQSAVICQQLERAGQSCVVVY